MKLKISTTSKLNSVDYAISSKDFTWVQTPIKKLSHVTISVAHDGMEKNSFLGFFHFRKHGVTKGRDRYVFEMVRGVAWSFPINIICGLIPRQFIDYNRYSSKDEFAAYAGSFYEDTEEACEDPTLIPFHKKYHDTIIEVVNKSKSMYGNRALFIDFHGFKNQPEYGNYDIILGTVNKKTVRSKIDEIIAYELEKIGYTVFLPKDKSVREGVFDEFDCGFTTRNVFLKTNADCIQIEVHASIRTDKQKSIKFSREFREILKKIYGEI